MAKNITGENNKIVLFDDAGNEFLFKKKIDGLDIICHGNNNTVRIHKETRFISSLFHIGNDNVNIEIGKSACLCINVRCCFGDGQTFKIGDGTQIGQATFFLDERSGCLIGNDCMFSNGVTVWGADGHGIIDCAGGGYVNAVNAPVVIGNHVWIGFQSTILKESKISDNSVLGACSVLAKKFEEQNVAIAGNPAKIVRTNINWSAQSAFMAERTVNS